MYWLHSTAPTASSLTYPVHTARLLALRHPPHSIALATSVLTAGVRRVYFRTLARNRLGQPFVPRERLFGLTPAVLRFVAPRYPLSQPVLALPNPANRHLERSPPISICWPSTCCPSVRGASLISPGRSLQPQGQLIFRNGSDCSATTPGDTVAVWQHRLTALPALSVQCRSH